MNIEKELKEYNKYESQWLILWDEAEALTITSHTDLSKAEDLQKKCQKLRIEIENTRKDLVKPYNDLVWQINTKAKELILPIQNWEIIVKQKMLNWKQEEERKRLEKEKELQRKITLIKQTNFDDELKELIVSFWEIDDNRVYTACELQQQEFERRKREQEEKEKREAEEKRLEELRKKQNEEQARIEAEKIELERERREIEEAKAKLEMEKLESEVKEKDPIPVKVKWERKVVKFEITNENQVPRSLCSPDEKKIREFVKNWVKEIPWVRVREENAIW